MPALNEQLDSHAIITAIAIFVLIDLILKQVLNKMALTFQYKVDTLSDVIRPSLQLLEEIKKRKEVTEQEKNELIAVVKRMKPLPLKSILDAAEKIQTGPFNNDKSIELLYDKLNESKSSSIKFISTYLLGFERLETASPTSALIGLLSICACWGWIPALILYFLGGISLLATTPFLLLAIVYEFYVRGRAANTKV